jgi:hypothetical protein
MCPRHRPERVQGGTLLNIQRQENDTLKNKASRLVGTHSYGTECCVFVSRDNNMQKELGLLHTIHHSYHSSFISFINLWIINSSIDQFISPSIHQFLIQFINSSIHSRHFVIHIISSFRHSHHFVIHVISSFVSFRHSRHFVIRIISSFASFISYHVSILIKLSNLNKCGCCNPCHFKRNVVKMTKLLFKLLLFVLLAGN